MLNDRSNTQFLPKQNLQSSGGHKTVYFFLIQSRRQCMWSLRCQGLCEHRRDRAVNSGLGDWQSSFLPAAGPSHTHFSIATLCLNPVYLHNTTSREAFPDSTDANKYSLSSASFCLRAPCSCFSSKHTEQLIINIDICVYLCKVYSCKTKSNNVCVVHGHLTNTQHSA